MRFFFQYKKKLNVVRDDVFRHAFHVLEVFLEIFFLSFSIMFLYVNLLKN